MAYRDIEKKRATDRLRQQRCRSRKRLKEALLKEAVTPSIIVADKDVEIADKGVTSIPETPKKRSALMDWVFSDI